jgi:hypothetical protein
MGNDVFNALPRHGGDVGRTQGGVAGMVVVDDEVGVRVISPFRHLV